MDRADDKDSHSGKMIANKCYIAGQKQSHLQAYEDIEKEYLKEFDRNIEILKFTVSL